MIIALHSPTVWGFNFNYMTTKEQQTIDALNKSVQQLISANRDFSEVVNRRVDDLSNRVDQKHIPINLENEIVNTVQNAITKALSEALTNSYNSPLVKYAQNVVSRYQTQIEGIFDEAVKEGIQAPEFKVRVREVLLNKIAKTMISGVDGSIDKTINLMKQDAIFRSRLTLSVNSLVDEFLNKKP